MTVDCAFGLIAGMGTSSSLRPATTTSAVKGKVGWFFRSGKVMQPRPLRVRSCSAGEGYTVNVPWEETGLSDGDYLAAFDLIVEPIVEEYDPELVLISAGCALSGMLRGIVKVEVAQGCLRVRAQVRRRCGGPNRAHGGDERGLHAHGEPADVVGPAAMRRSLGGGLPPVHHLRRGGRDCESSPGIHA